MKIISIIFFIFIYCNSFGQLIISGSVIDSYDGSSLKYVNVGIVNTPLSTISNEEGKYNLSFPKEYLDSMLRFSMMGYEDFIISIRKLKDRKNTLVNLKPKLIELTEIKIKGNAKDYKVGTTSRSAMSGFCGWGGNRRGKGHEIGLKIELGKSNVLIKKIHIRIHKQSFYSCLLRLHIRKYENGLPTYDLLNENILLPIKQSSGWVDFDLSRYNIILKGDVVVTIEWIDVSGIDKTKLSRVNKSPKKTANVLISIKKDQGITFMKRGSEAKWSKYQSQSPSIYLTISK